MAGVLAERGALENAVLGEAIHPLLELARVDIERVAGIELANLLAVLDTSRNRRHSFSPVRDRMAGRVVSDYSRLLQARHVLPAVTEHLGQQRLGVFAQLRRMTPRIGGRLAELDRKADELHSAQSRMLVVNHVIVGQYLRIVG